MRPMLCVPDKWWHGRGHWKQVRDQKTRWKTPKEKEMTPVLCLPVKWWHGRGPWKQVTDQKTKWKTPKEKGIRPVLVYLRNGGMEGGTGSKAETRRQRMGRV
jgi:hypothetical protein